MAETYDAYADPYDGAVDERGEIIADVECHRCAYNLRGLRYDGRCPECGTPAGLSLYGDLLRYADPQWVAKVALGVKIIVYMLLFGMLLVGASQVVGLLVSHAMGAVLGFGVQLISFYGVWLMTEADPSGIGEDPNITARKVVRFTLVFGLISSALGSVADVVTPSMQIKAAVIAIAIVAGLIGMAGEFAKFIFYERLAERIPDAHLAGRARMLRWGFVICLGVVVIGGLALGAMALSGGVTKGGMNMGAAGGIVCLMAPAGIGLLVFGIMTFTMLWRLMKALGEQVKLARQTWADAMPAARPAAS